MSLDAESLLQVIEDMEEPHYSMAAVDAACSDAKAI